MSAQIPILGTLSRLKQGSNKGRDLGDAKPTRNLDEVPDDLSPLLRCCTLALRRAVRVRAGIQFTLLHRADTIDDRRSSSS
jgi:hypothetical protein